MQKFKAEWRYIVTLRTRKGTNVSWSGDDFLPESPVPDHMLSEGRQKPLLITNLPDALVELYKAQSMYSLDEVYLTRVMATIPIE